MSREKTWLTAEGNYDFTNPKWFTKQKGYHFDEYHGTPILLTEINRIRNDGLYTSSIILKVMKGRIVSTSEEMTLYLPLAKKK